LIQTTNSLNPITPEHVYKLLPWQFLLGTWVQLPAVLLRQMGRDNKLIIVLLRVLSHHPWYASKTPIIIT
jgi:hypothetical protein